MVNLAHVGIDDGSCSVYRYVADNWLSCKIYMYMCVYVTLLHRRAAATTITGCE